MFMRETQSTYSMLAYENCERKERKECENVAFDPLGDFEEGLTLADPSNVRAHEMIFNEPANASG